MSGVDGYNPLPSDSEKEARDKEAQGESLRALIPDWVRTGRMVKGIHIDAGQTLGVQHGLKRKPEGWILVAPRDQQQAGVVYTLIELGRDVAKLTLTNTGNTDTIYFDIWVW